MFISLGSILTSFSSRHKIKNQINKITVAEVSEKIIKTIINSDIKIVWCRNNHILLKTKTSAAANEIKMREGYIKTELEKNNIQISSIKCVI